MNEGQSKTTGTGFVFRGEFLLAGVVMLAAGLLILPAPCWLVDLLLALNISLAVVLLLLALQVGDALRVAAFPTMLLVATLFRLSLNVSTTRLILLQADAGEVVRTFGHFVVSGNPLVGAVVFLILTVVQFIVIAKGSERVAEVTARFTLDAMPGKQMSIDADLRAGTIDQGEAGRRRVALEREAQFHGSMDGAMKFVKGDAVAGIVITCVNIGGGLLVGVLQRGLDAGQAVSTYAVLTIGDGLVSQIPALLISVAAGLVVTRVRSEKSSGNLGRQIAAQVGAHPEVLGLAGLLLLMLSLVPGMPTLSFGLLGSALLFLGWMARSMNRRRKGRQADRIKENTALQVALELPAGKGVPGKLDDSLERIRRQMVAELGIRMPAIQAVCTDSRHRWTVRIDGMPVASGPSRIKENELLDRVGNVLRRSAACFVGVQETQDMLDELERVQPALVREVVPRLVPTVLLSEILVRLVEEGVPVVNLRGILAALAEWARIEADPAQLTERVRNALASLISHRVAPEGELSPLLLDPAVEQVMERSLSRGEGGTLLQIDPNEGEAILSGLDRALARTNPGQVVVLTRPDLRRPFWKLISQTHPHVRVVSFLELDPDMSVRPAGRVALAAA